MKSVKAATYTGSPEKVSRSRAVAGVVMIA